MQNDITNLIAGYKKFYELYFEQENSTFADLVRQGQRPKVLMIACSDSRVDPALVMNCQPGELFVIRNVANLVPPYEEDLSHHGTSAALEFGICVLGIRHVILFGHTQCGGIQSLLNPSQEQRDRKSFLSKWMELAKPALEQVATHHANDTPEEKTVFCGQYSLINSLENLQTFPWIAERVQQGILSLHAWNFDMAHGILSEYDVQQKRFRKIRFP